MARGRIMGIDFGMKRIGIALSDMTQTIAKGFETVNWNGRDSEYALNRICDIIKEQEVVAIVVGRPRRTDGKKSETEEKAEAFAETLKEMCGIEPVFKDERYTTVIATQFLRESNVKAKNQRKVIDQVAAEVILQDWLDSRKK